MMLDGLLKNPRLVEGMLGSLLRLVPPETWKMIAAELGKLNEHAAAIRAQLDRIEAATADNTADIEFLSTVCRSGIPDAGVMFAEREMFRPDKRTEIGGIPLADIQRGQVNGG